MRFQQRMPPEEQAWRPTGSSRSRTEEKLVFVGELVIPVADVMRALQHPGADLKGETFVLDCLRSLEGSCAVMVDQMLADGSLPTHGAAFYLGHATFEAEQPSSKGVGDFYLLAPVMLVRGLMRFNVHDAAHMRNQPSDLLETYYRQLWKVATR